MEIRKPVAHLICNPCDSLSSGRYPACTRCGRFLFAASTAHAVIGSAPGAKIVVEDPTRWKNWTGDSGHPVAAYFERFHDRSPRRVILQPSRHRYE